jgi:hypothetical protein
MYKDADGRLYTREELDAAPGDLLRGSHVFGDYAREQGRTIGEGCTE